MKQVFSKDPDIAKLQRKVLNLGSRVVSDKKALELEVEREWEERQRKKKSADIKSKLDSDSVVLSFEDEDTFKRAVKIFSEGMEKKQNNKIRFD